MDTWLGVLGAALPVAGGAVVAWIRYRKPAPKSTPGRDAREVEDLRKQVASLTTRVDSLATWLQTHYQSNRSLVERLDFRIGALESDAQRDSDASDVRQLRDLVEKMTRDVGRIEGMIEAMHRRGKQQ